MPAPVLLGRVVGWAQPPFDPAVGATDGASTPSGRSPPNPAQAGPGASACSNRGSGGHVVVLVGCSGCRSRREASGPTASPRSGLAIQPRARVVKGRRKPARGGKAARTVASSRRSRDLGPHGSGDRAERLGRSVSGRRRKPSAGHGPERGRGRSSREGVLAPMKRASLTRRSGKRAWRLLPEGSDRKVGALPAGRRQRTSEAMPQARHAAENAAAGRHRAEELFDRSSARTAWRCGSASA
jgi:hypothetical protein